MSKKSNFILKGIKLLTYFGCLTILVIGLNGNYVLNNNESIVGPMIYIENVILRAVVMTIILTFAGFNLIKQTMMSNKIKSGFMDRYLAMVFFVVGISYLFLPTTKIKIAMYFSLSILLSISYLTSVKIHENKQYDKFR